MIVEGKLSALARGRGRNIYRSFNMLNSVSFSLLGDNVLILFALAMGAPPYCAAILAALMYLGNAGVLLGRKNIARHGASGNIAMTWLSGSLCMISAVLAPFATGFIGEAAAFWVFLLPAALGFYFFRAAGMVSIQSLWGEICEAGRARGRFIAELWNRSTMIALAVFALLSLVTRYSDRIEIYQLILFIGVLSGVIASWVISKSKESGVARESARKPLADALQAIREDRNIRNYMWAGCAAFSALAIIAPIPLLMAKNGYGIADDQVLILIIVQLFGSILVASVNGQVMGHTGPRPLVVIYFLLLPVLCVMLYLAPNSFSWFYFGLIFLVNGGIISGVPMALSNYSLNLMPEDKRVGLSLMSSVIAGGGAGISGLLFTSGLLKTLSSFGESGLALYRWYLVYAFVMLFVFLIFIFRLKPLKDWGVKQVLGLLIAPRDIRTIYTINRLDERSDSPETEDAGIDKLSALKSPLSLESLLESVESPKYNVRRKALLALRSHPDDEKITRAMLRELEQGEYSTAYLAAFVLGERRTAEAVPALIKMMSSEDVFLRSECMVALVRLKHEDSYEQITTIFSQTNNPRLLIHGGEALRRIATPGALYALLEKAESCHSRLPGKVSDEMSIYVAEILGFGRSFYGFSKKLNKSEPEDKQELLTDLIIFLGKNEPAAELSMAVSDYFNGSGASHKMLDLMRAEISGANDPLLAAVSKFLNERTELQNELLLFCLFAACYRHKAE